MELGGACLINFRALLNPFSGLTSNPRIGSGPTSPLYPNRSINKVVTSRFPASVLGSIAVAIRVFDIVVLSFGRGEFAAAASSNRGEGGLTGVIGRFPGVSSANAGTVFNPPLEIGFLLDSSLNAKACLTGVTTDAESGFLGVVMSRTGLLVVGTFSESRVYEADSPLLFDGDGVAGVSSGRNRGGAKTRAWTGGFLGVTVSGFGLPGGNAFSKTTGRSFGRLGVVEVNPSGSNNRGRLDGG